MGKKKKKKSWRKGRWINKRKKTRSLKLDSSESKGLDSFEVDFICSIGVKAWRALFNLKSTIISCVHTT